MARETVQRFVRAEDFPERQAKARRPTQLTPYEPYLHERWAAGCHNAYALWQEVRGQGFPGCASSIRHHLATWRPASAQGRRQRRAGVAGPPERAATAYTLRQTLWLLLRPADELDDDEQAYVAHLYHACPHVALAQALVQDFRTLLREHDVDGLYAWLRGAEACPIPDLRRVAKAMWLDRRAIEAAVALEWSNGQVEGRVNKLKVLKKGMYGRAKFDLLRQRVLHAA